MKIKDEVNRLRKLAWTEIELKKDDLRRFAVNIVFVQNDISPDLQS